MSEPVWLAWSRELQAIAQSGLTYTRDPFDVERYEQVHALALRMMAHGSNTDMQAVEALFAGAGGGMPRPRSACGARCSKTTRCCWCAKARTAYGRCPEAGRT